MEYRTSVSGNLKGEPHVKDIDYIATLEAYVHWKLTGKRVLGIGDVAGMFPVDSTTRDYNEKMVQQFDEQVASLDSHGSFAAFCRNVLLQDRCWLPDRRRSKAS